MLDYYKILKVSRTATEDEIRQAYYKKAKRYHPDVCHEAGATELFALLNEAWQTLGHPQKRKRYDLKLTYGAMLSRPPADHRHPPQPSAAYEAYRIRRREEIIAENRRLRRINRVLNNFMFWIMAVFLAVSILFGLIDAFTTGDYGMLVFDFVFIVVALLYYFYIRRRRE